MCGCQMITFTHSLGQKRLVDTILYRTKLWTCNSSRKCFRNVFYCLSHSLLHKKKGRHVVTISYLQQKTIILNNQNLYDCIWWFFCHIIEYYRNSILVEFLRILGLTLLLRMLSFHCYSVTYLIISNTPNVSLLESLAIWRQLWWLSISTWLACSHE